MPFTVPAVPQDEPDAAVPAGVIGEAAEILALISGLLAAEPEAGTAAARFPGAMARTRCPPCPGSLRGPAGSPASWRRPWPPRASPATASCPATGGGRHD
jgi:hypothetical protein